MLARQLLKVAHGAAFSSLSQVDFGFGQDICTVIDVFVPCRRQNAAGQHSVVS